MKKQILLMTIFASVPSLANTVSGEVAYETVKQTFLGFQPIEGHLDNTSSGSDCVAEMIGSSIQIQARGVPSLNLNLIAENLYELSNRIESDGSYVLELKSASDDESLTMTMADDAFENVTIHKKGVTLSCQMDM